MSVILIGNGSDLAFPYHDHYKKQLKGVKIVPVDSVVGDNHYLSKPEVGMVFIKHPYLDLYLPNNEELELNIYRQSIQEVFNLAQDLGALKCDYTLTIEQRKFLGIKAKGKVSNPKGEGEMSVEGSVDKNFWQQLNMSYENARVDGSTIITAEEFEKAKRRLQESEYLRRDPIARNMLEMRDPNSINQRKKMHLTYSLIEDINEDLAVAAKLKAAGGVLNIKGSYTQKQKITRKVSATYTISFIPE